MSQAIRDARRPMRHRLLLAVAMAAAALSAVPLFWSIEAQLIDELRDRARHALTLYRVSVRGALDEFRSAPALLTQHPATLAALAAPADGAAIDAANRFFESTNDLIGSSDVYLMNDRGRTIAASNWRGPRPFVGRNFDYRPYFRDAIEGEAGRYYALGTTSGKRGYFFSAPVWVNGVVRGVVVVKVQIGAIEARFGDEEHAVAVIDGDGVVFMASRRDWLYRPAYPLGADAMRAIAANQRYAGRSILDAPIMTARPTIDGGLMDVDDAGRRRTLVVSTGMPALGWTIAVLADARALHQRAAGFAALSAAFGVALVGAVAGVIARRRHAAERARFERERSAQLEREVEARTADLKRAQDELVQATKLAAIGRLSAGVSHELNQPLTAMRSYADNARKLLEAGRLDAVGDNLAQIGGLTTRMDAIIRQLKVFARESRDVSEPVDVGAAIRGALTLLNARLRADGVAVKVAARAAPVLVRGDALRLEQVIVNLLANALDAMAGSPTRRLDIALTVRGGDAVLDVVDSGPGVPDALRDQIFEPFVTTKDVGEGLGLGLSISYGIVSDMGGRIALRQDAGAGAAFRLTLPLDAAIEEDACRIAAQ